MSQVGEGVVGFIVLQSQVQPEALAVALFSHGVLTIALDLVLPSRATRGSGIAIVAEGGSPALIAGVASAVVEVAVDGADVPEVGLQIRYLRVGISASGLPQIAQ